MVQIIEENRRPVRDRGPSTADRFKNAFANSIGIGAEIYLKNEEKKLKQQKLDKEIESLEKLTGLNLKGIEDPKILQMAAKYALDSKQLYPKMENQQRQQEIVAKALAGQGLSQEELNSLPPQTQMQLSRMFQPKGGNSFQSIPQEISSAMNQVINAMPESTSDELKMAFDEIGIPPGYSNAYVENRRRQEERQSASRDKRLELGQKRAEKALDKVDIIGHELPMLESSIMTMEDAIQNGDLSFWSPDNLAEATGIELFRTAKGAQFKTAAKNYFLNDLKTSGARPNQFIEKQLVDSLAKIGRSQEANQAVVESFKFSNDLKRNYVETARALEKQYYNSMGSLPGNFNSIIEEATGPYIKQRQKDYESRLKELAHLEKSKSKKSSKSSLSISPSPSKSMIVQVRGPDGQMYETESENIEMLPEGYQVL